MLRVDVATQSVDCAQESTCLGKPCALCGHTVDSTIVKTVPARIRVHDPTPVVKHTSGYRSTAMMFIVDHLAFEWSTKYSQGFRRGKRICRATFRAGRKVPESPQPSLDTRNLQST